jgi:hypothetical protein
LGASVPHLKVFEKILLYSVGKVPVLPPEIRLANKTRERAKEIYLTGVVRELLVTLDVVVERTLAVGH